MLHKPTINSRGKLKWHALHWNSWMLQNLAACRCIYQLQKREHSVCSTLLLCTVLQSISHHFLKFRKWPRNYAKNSRDRSHLPPSARESSPSEGIENNFTGEPVCKSLHKIFQPNANLARGICRSTPCPRNI